MEKLFILLKNNVEKVLKILKIFFVISLCVFLICFYCQLNYFISFVFTLIFLILFGICLICNRVSIIKGESSELVFSQVFHDTILNSEWLKDKCFSPGRFALGYPALYALYRILNDKKPKCILELGLGQSTNMISQYAAYYDDVLHIVVEHDENWANFYSLNHKVGDRTKILTLPIKKVKYKKSEIYSYDNFKDTLASYKFDFICIDAPFGFGLKGYKGMNAHSRTDVISLIPQGIADDYTILFDDCNRIGEFNTANDMMELLKSNNKEPVCGFYSGNKNTMLITSQQNKFLTTL